VKKILQPLMMLMVRADRIIDAYNLALSDASDNAEAFYTIAVNAWAKSYWAPPNMDRGEKKKLWT